jgi:hypothetical protein
LDWLPRQAHRARSKRFLLGGVPNAFCDMLIGKDQNPTALERAFQLAKPGKGPG